MYFVCGCDQPWKQQYWCRGRGGDRSWSAWRAVADVAEVRDAGVGDVYDGGEDRRSGVMGLGQAEWCGVARPVSACV